MESAGKQEDIHMNAQGKQYELLIQMAKLLLQEKLLTSNEYTNILTAVWEES